MFTILGAIPYMVLGLVLATAGVMWNVWQFWAILGCMAASDIISRIRGTIQR